MSNYFATALVALVLAYCVATSLVKGTTDNLNLGASLVADAAARMND